MCVLMSIRVTTLQLIYCKTPLGQKAITSRSMPLLALERRVLILIDGERTVAELYQLLSQKNIFESIASLKEKGLIRCIAGEDPPVPTPPPPVPHFISASASMISLADADLSAVKSLMISSSRQGLGLMAVRLVQDIEEINDAQTLKATMARWNMALRESRSAAAQADQLLQEAKALLPAAL